MNWSMKSVSFRMSGSGSWQNLLTDEATCQLYAEIYPAGAPLQRFDGRLRHVLAAWREAAIVKVEGQKVVPLGPIVTDEDLSILAGWFRDISDTMCAAVEERLFGYRSLAEKVAGRKAAIRREVDNILTIMICAHTLDSWVFAQLREELIGTYPPRGFAGDFFFWGYAFSTGPKRIFGFTTYGGWGRLQLHVIRSHELDREKLKEVLRQRATWDYLYRLFSVRQAGAGVVSGERFHLPGEVVEALRDVGLLERDDPASVAVPIFTDENTDAAVGLHQMVSGKVMGRFMDSMDELKALVRRCSFAGCSWSDIMCMLFHLSYSYAADKLVERGVIPDFPQSAGAEWGVWIRL